ncbi:FecR domain-containing protein [Chitinophaga oryzae]|uniref:FecR domain-containing protein n=1 Tax=Chitinophaga oryzae TaxID=2725414 RepID=A0AAE6ZIR5_9BACT|nr:FecR family protein [Chitinophaga oryzae]QJB33502.1 FecR domain-containing protein [Chitinophaga oryzae]
MDNNRLKYLLSQYTTRTATSAELEELSAFLGSDDQDAQLEWMIEEAWIQSAETETKVFGTRSDDMLARILSAKTTKRPLVKTFYRNYRAAAAILLLVLASGGALWTRQRKKPAPVATTQHKVFLPGSDKAILTLANGKTIELDSNMNGQIAQQGHVSLQTKAGQLVYKPQAASSETAVSWNTLRTPKGGQYSLVLPDGSRVWLNAASSLQYPTSFAGPTRQVSLSGEAYFEIQPNAAQPFFVNTGETAVAVLGTSFNIMAYNNENSIRTTLLQGSVRVSRQTAHHLLKPGQQSLINQNGTMEVIDHADTDLAVAWKNGLISFRSADIRTIMRQVERWYNIEVVFKGEVPTRTFTGDIPRTADLSALLRLLEISKIHFKLEEEKLIVM